MKKRIKQEFYYLKRQKYISFESVGDNIYKLKITDKGLAQVLNDNFDLLKLYSHQKWDGKWRMVIFDIPEKFKSAREGFRNKLQEIGFYRAQDSVFITPFPCEKEIIFLSEIFNIVPFVYFIETNRFLNDKNIRRYFEV